MPPKAPSKIAMLESLQTILYRLQMTNHAAKKFVENYTMSSIVMSSQLDVGMPLTDMISMCSSINQAMTGSDRCMLLTSPPVTPDARYTEAIVLSTVNKDLGIVISNKSLRGVEFDNKDFCKKLLGSFTTEAKDMLFPTNYLAKPVNKAHCHDAPILRMFYDRDTLEGECVVLRHTTNLPSTVTLTPHDRVLCVDLSQITRPVVFKKSQQSHAFEFFL